MTVKELSQLYYLNREIEQAKKKLEELETAAQKVTPNITGLPHIREISDKTALAVEIADCKAEIEAKAQLTVIEYNRLHRYIDKIEDSLTRQVLSLRYIDGLSWRQVAYRVGGGNTEDSVRKAAFRYVNRH